MALFLTRDSRRFIQALLRRNEMFIVTSQTESDDSIVFASPSFLEFTQYQQDEVIGRNGDFFLHKDTPNTSLERINTAIKEMCPEAAWVTIQKKNLQIGSCHLFVCAIDCREGECHSRMFMRVIVEMDRLTAEQEGLISCDIIPQQRAERTERS
eukprot:c8554_g1_i1.p1 GENE.c8554_g1_i1~~c8554_g1_i1.p1  ORF type:complete len:154 (+),score=38.13 c8554_g1_i1:39-500(+)